jgi:hypothetical protein
MVVVSALFLGFSISIRDVLGAGTPAIAFSEAVEELKLALAWRQLES